MNTTSITSYSSEQSWTSWYTPGHSRRGSIESELSIQGKETDYVRDTSDTDCSSKVEYEPASEPEDEGPFDSDSSGQSDNDIIATKVIEVSVGDDGDLEFADSEQTESSGSDSEMDLHDFWQCVQCKAENNNPLYRYCEKCFKVRKNFFPPRPRRNKRKRVSEVPRTISVDSGVESAFNSQESLSQPSQPTDSQATDIQVTDSQVSNSQPTDLSQPGFSQTDYSDLSQPTDSQNDIEGISSTRKVIRPLKRRAESADRNEKRIRIDYSSDSDDELRRRKAKRTDPEVAPLLKTTSDPSLTIDDSVKLSQKAIINSIKEKLYNENLCIICYAEPKSAVFVHGRIAHICCCYECANKVWRKAKRCPQCNCKVSNVLRVL